MTAVAPTVTAASHVSRRILRLGCRTRGFDAARFTRYGACTYTGSGDALSASASGWGAGFFHPWGLERNSWISSDPVDSAPGSGSEVRRWAPIFGRSFFP